MLLGMIGTAHQGTGFDIAETQFHADIVQLFEFIGMEEARNGKMMRRRLKILPERKDIDFDLDEIGHDFYQFFTALSETEHDTCLRNKSFFLCAAQYLQR